eukprot:CAMPEP_0115478310 /NCGR_PEP_ID=MMETSP0271-20121206/56136_1 /TAXON_ID=71861 /ORGANISM="Scrippsiella trochoidea, Strain CCMP3099" /LENGTH=91 /DNA_ID=CAMNT_0002905849 /DNA_START=445 /DNA_END=720 /DNA_ORIENTATION=+
MEQPPKARSVLAKAMVTTLLVVHQGSDPKPFLTVMASCTPNTGASRRTFQRVGTKSPGAKTLSMMSWKMTQITTSGAKCLPDQPLLLSKTR